MEMTDGVVNLSIAGAQWPESIIVDCNVAVHVLRISGLRLLAEAPAMSPDPSRIWWMLGELRHRETRMVVTPTIMSEVVHVVTRAGYQHLVRTLSVAQMLHRYGRVFRHWSQLYKHDASILTSIIAEMEDLPELLKATGLIFVDPTRDVNDWSVDFLPELLQISKRFGLDSNDARILLEAQSLGIPHIVSLDRDMQRAAPDFTVYTWL